MAASDGYSNSIIEKFREAARARGIDPVAGATTYQVCNVKAELEFAKKKTVGGWWKSDPAMWENDWWTDNVQRSAECEAVRNIEHAAKSLKQRPAPVIIDAAYINEGLRAQGLADLPLKQLHELQRTLQKQKRERVKWVPGAGGVPQRVSVGVYA